MNKIRGKYKIDLSNKFKRITEEKSVHILTVFMINITYDDQRQKVFFFQVSSVLCYTYKTISKNFLTFMTSTNEKSMMSAQVMVLATRN